MVEGIALMRKASPKVKKPKKVGWGQPKGIAKQLTIKPGKHWKGGGFLDFNY